ncbi:hypothetical protein Tco_1304446 [Tanacetum coccineum]
MQCETLPNAVLAVDTMNNTKKVNNQKHQAAKDAAVGCTLWTDGLICAFEAKLRVNGCWETEYTEFESDDNEVAVADIAVPYREQPEMLAAGGSNLPQTIHEVIPLLACRLARWNDRKYIFGAADKVEL